MNDTKQTFELPSDMAAVEMTAAGGPEVLAVGRRPLPQPAPGEVLIKVAAAGVNGPDLMQRKGLYPPPAGASDLIGLEVSGTVVATGANVTGWQVGEQVIALANGGGYAEYCAVDAGYCLPVPDGVSIEAAAGIPEPYFTVWSNIFEPKRLSANGTLLVHGGAGSVGSTAIQLGKAFGATVFATESPASRCDYCRKLGADYVIDYREEDFVGVTREKAGGANVILDIVGGPNIAKNIKAAAPGGHIVQLAFAQGSRLEIDLMPIMLKRLVFTGSTLRSRPAEYKTMIAAELLTHVWPLFSKGQLIAEAGHVFPFSQARAAHALMEKSGHIGKIILVPDA